MTTENQQPGASPSPDEGEGASASPTPLLDHLRESEDNTRAQYMAELRMQLEDARRLGLRNSDASPTVTSGTGIATRDFGARGTNKS